MNYKPTAWKLQLIVGNFHAVFSNILMKNLQRFALLPLIILMAFACSQQGGNEHEGKHKTGSSVPDAAGFYGQAFETADAVAAYKIPTLLSDTNIGEMVVNGNITAVCQMSGCWLEMDLMNGETIYVTFKNDSFTIPKDSKGKNATIKGFLSREEISVDMLKRMAAEEGQTEEQLAAINQPKQEYTFVATGLLFQGD